MVDDNMLYIYQSAQEILYRDTGLVVTPKFGVSLVGSVIKEDQIN